MRLLVTHRSPDLDAIGSIWVLKRFDSEHYADSKLAFVNAGDTIDLRTAADLGFAPEDITHTDTGLGTFDHHQEERGMLRVCATSIVYDFCATLHPELKKDKALFFLVEYVTAIDHFEEQSWPDAANLRYQLFLHNLIEGAKRSILENDEAVVHFGFSALDAAYSGLSEQIAAQDELEEKKIEFDTPWGLGVAIESSNDEVLRVAQKTGYVIAIRRDPQGGYVRLKAVPGKNIDLTPIANEVKRRDPVGHWYFHSAKTMLLNGSSKDPNRKPTNLSLAQIIEIFATIQL